MSAPKPRTAQSGTLQERLVTLCKHPQFVWFLGHVLLLLCSLRYAVSFIMFSASSHRLAYRSAFFGSLITYGIVLFKTYSNPRTRGPINIQLAAKIWADENMQYFVFAFYWCFVADPVFVALVPYTIFSVFHFLTYMKTNVVPAIDPASSAQDSKSPGARFVQLSGAWTKQNHEPAMKLVSSVEVLALGSRVLLGVVSFGYLFGRTSFTTLLVVVSFLRYRYLTSAFTRQTFTHLGLQIDHALSDARVPPVALTSWRSVKGLLSNYLGTTPGGPPQAQTAQRKAQ